ncbi:MAG: hypothetical protein RL748_2871, partial [Pseudomonadota bacterium]
MLNQIVIPEHFQQFESLVALGRYRAEHQKSKMVYSMLKYGVEFDDKLSYETLDLKARAVAAQLQGMGVAGRNALLLFPSGLEFVVAFMGCLYAKVAPVPTPLPGRKDKDWIKTGLIACDADVAVVLTMEEHGKYIRESMEEDEFLRNIPCLDSDTLDTALAAKWVDPQVSRDDLAFLQYTSGSTGMPKGVMVTHGNLLHNEEMMRKAYQHTEDTVYVSWLPLFHDMGLIGNVLHTLYLGGQCYLMTPVAFLQQPLRWLQAVSEFKASTCFAPNFAYELCLRRISEEQRDKLDLSHWTLALNGAEPVRADTLERFAEYFGPCGFKWQSHYPAYGLAEATLFVSGTGRYNDPHIVNVDSQELQNNKVVYSDAAQGTQRLVSSGLTNTDQTVTIVNPDDFRRCADRSVGEIWIKGGSVAQGYWRKPEQTAETFQARISGDGDGPYLRTGDLGFVDEGRLFITGRLKDLVIVNGANFYPQDIELAIQKNHPALRLGYGAVFSIEQDGSEQVVVVQEVERTMLKKIDPQEVFANIRQTVAREFQIGVAAIILIKPMMLPLTSSGKVQRRESRKRFYDYTLAEVASWYGSDNLRREIEGGLTPPAPVASQVSDSATKAQTMIQWLRQYGDSRVNSALIDERRSVPPYIVMDFAQHGLLGMNVPEKFAGRALTISDSLRVMEQLAALDANLAAMVAVHNVLGTRPIMNFATGPLKDRLLPRIAEGRMLGALAITEPAAGSNPHAIRTIARPAAQGGWLINGEKCWIGNGSWAGVINTFVQVVDTSGHPKGMAAFAIEQGRPGMRMGEEAPTMGMRGMVQNRIHFKDVHVTEDDLLGRVGQGMEVAQDAMMHGRLVIGAMSLGGMKRVAQLMTRFAQRRDVATGRLLDNPVSIMRLSQLHAAIHAVQAMLRCIGSLLDQGEAIPAEIYAACKTSAPEFLWHGIDQAMQMLGGRGYTENNVLPQMMRDLRLFRIFEGPTEALNLFIGSRVMGDSKSMMNFVASALGAAHEVQAMTTLSNEVLERATRCGRQAGMSSAQINQMAQDFVGQLCTLHIVRAFVYWQKGKTPSTPLQQAHDWLGHRIETGLAGMRASLGETPVWSDSSKLYDAAQDLVHDIGDLQQQAAGMERDLDPLLLRESRPAIDMVSFDEQPAMPTLVPETQWTASTSTQDEIEQWMLGWLSRQRRVGAEEMDASTTFVDVGLDSVSAVELAFALQDWLGFEVDSTVVWQYPSIGALSRALAQEKEARTAPES